MTAGLVAICASPRRKGNCEALLAAFLDGKIPERMPIMPKMTAVITATSMEMTGVPIHSIQSACTGMAPQISTIITEATIPKPPPKTAMSKDSNMNWLMM